MVPNGFPFQFAAAGLLPKNGSVKHSVVLPKEVDMSTLKTNVVFYLNPMANLTQALAALVREPYGCFEVPSASLCLPFLFFASLSSPHGFMSTISIETRSKRRRWPTR